MAELWELVSGKILHGLFVCLIFAVIILLVSAIWYMAVYYTTQARVKAVKRIYNTIKLNEPKEGAVMRFRDYSGSKDQYMEEALLPNGKHEELICLLFSFGRGETGEIRLTYVDNRLVRKQQSGIW